jgi:hypothetical protein
MTVRMAMVVALATLAATDAEAQGLSQYYGPDGKVYSRRALDSDYAPPNVPSDIIAPERPRVAPRQRKAAPPIAVLPLDPPVPANGANTNNTSTSADGAGRDAGRDKATPTSRMVRARGQCESPAVPQHRIIEGAAMTNAASIDHLVGSRLSASARKPRCRTPIHHACCRGRAPRRARNRAAYPTANVAIAEASRSPP